MDRGPVIPPRLELRLARPADLEALRAVMTLAINRLQDSYLTPEQIVASRAIMGLDTQLIEDGTYFVVTAGEAIAGCGGWSYRATLYGGDHSTDLRDGKTLDPAVDAARVRAMYTHPEHVRRGVGRMILQACERAAAAAGFRTAELMATLSGEPLYAAAGYRPVEEVAARVGAVSVPLVRMSKPLALA